MQRNQNQTQYILDFYVKGLLEDKQFDFLKKFGFLDILLQCTANADFDTFEANIDRIANEEKYRNGSKGYKAVQNLKKHWREEIEAIQKCVDCYEIWTTNETNKDYFTLVCTKPHLLVYVKEAKEEGPRMWPAKVLSINDNDEKVTIECFGDYLRADYAFAECFLYSDAQEMARERANSKYSKNFKIVKQEEYKRSFPEVKKYIENIKKKYGSFVPATNKVKITDVKQHLIDMYPDAFSKSSVATGIIEPQSTSVEEVNNTIETYGAGPSTSKTHNNKSAARKMSPVSLGYASLLSTNDSDSIDSDDAHDFVDQRPITPFELPPVDIKIEQVVENYSQYNDESDNESQAQDDSVGDQGLDGLKAERSRKANPKRKTVNSALMREQPHRAAKKVCAPTSHAADSVITIVDDDDTEMLPTSSQSRSKSATNDKDFNAMLDELCEIVKKVSKCEEQLKKLNEQEVFVHDKLRQGDYYGENLKILLVEFNKLMEEISECKKQLKELNKQKDVLRAKLQSN